MKLYKGRIKILLLVLAVIGGLLAFITFKTPMMIYLHKISGGRLFDDVPSTELTNLYFTGYEGTNILIGDPDDISDDCIYDSVNNVYDCETEIFDDDAEVELNYETAYSGAVVSIGLPGDDYPEVCLTGECRVTVTVTAPGTGLDPATYNIYYKRELKIETVKKNPVYWPTTSSGSLEFTVPRSGTYRIEVWGAQGGAGCLLNSSKTCTTTKYPGGNGAYAAGTITLTGGTKLYINNGGAGGPPPNNSNSTWSGGGNGGGLGLRSTGSYASGGGGGATDVRLIKETDNNKIESLASRIIVAGGGAGGSYNENPANWSTHGGGLDVGGLTEKSNYCVANQSSGFAFGYAYNDIQYATQTSIAIGGGGGGWYGGDGYVHSIESNSGGPGCGGTSYISGHTGSIGVNADGTPKKNALVSDDITDSYSNTGYVFTDTIIIDGYNRQWTTVPSEEAVAMPSSIDLDLSDDTQGNLGAGMVRITQIAKYAKIENVLTSLYYSDGTLDKTFKSDEFEYTLTLDTFTNTVEIGGTVANTTTTSVTENTIYNVEVGETKQVFVFVTDIASQAVNTYKINVVRPSLPSGTHSTLIEKIDNPNNPTIYMSKGVTTYDLPIRYGKMSVDLTVHLYDSDATYEIKGADFLLNNTGVITIEVTDPLATPNKTVYTFNYDRETAVAPVEDEYIYYFTGDYQTFITPITGDYKIEAWGAQGGSMQSGWTGLGGKGGYTSGEISLIQDTPLYIYVGGKGTGFFCCGNYLKAGGWNGGGNNYSGSSGGGGATDIRLISGNWNNTKSLNSRIMVAGGGGGSNDSQNGGYGGGLTGGIGVNGTSGNGSGGTQVSGGVGDVEGVRGGGGNAASTNYVDGGSGGGGYWGGGKASGYNVAGGGGSSYISGYLGAIAVSGESNANVRLDSEGNKCTTATALTDIVCSEHYSGYVFRNPIMAAGNEAQPTLDGKGTQTGNADAGYVKITPLSTKSENNFLENIIFDTGKRDPTDFSPTGYDYTITVGIYTQFIELEGVAYDPTATVEGDGKKLLEIGENKYTITVTAENGNVRNYNVTVIREGLKGAHSNMINNINIKDVGYIYPLKDVYEYDFKLPYNKYHVEMDFKLYDDDAKYEVTGADLVVANSGTIKINVYHEDGKVPDVEYTLHYVRQIPLYDVKGTYVYNCVKYEEEFIAPLDGNYYIQAWGAAGGGATTDYYSASHGGRGGYSYGTIRLEQGEAIYINVGCQGTYAYGLNQGGGWNGGGGGGAGGYGGGGATDIRYNGDTLAKRILVAGGGGGADNGGGSYGGGDDGSGGVGGGEVGENAKINGSYQPNTGGTQESGYKLGHGASATTNTDTGGAGGGYYGGLVTNNNNGGAGGGSGYVNTELFPDGKTISGNSSFFGVDGETQEFGHAGDGNAKITVLSYLSENYYLESITTDVGTWETAYDPAIKDYKILADTYDSYVNIEATAFDSYATIKGEGKYELDMGDNYFTLTVTAQNGATRVYTLNVVRQYLLEGHTAELQKIKLEGLGDIICEPGVYEYEFEIPNTTFYIDAKPIPYDPASKQSLKGFSYVPQTQVATITSRVSGAKTITYKVKLIKGDVETIFRYDFECTGDYQEFKAPVKGYYIFQLWGAQGGNRSGNYGGRGGYATGMLMLDKDEVVYVYVGCSGNNGGWNGGGTRDNFAGGGGASDVRTQIDDLYTRFIVAGGGGSVGSPGYWGGYGGGLTGGGGYGCGNGGGGATQTAGGNGGSAYSGTFGIGGHGISRAGGHGGGGGGGWYGGGGGYPDWCCDDDRSGGGGSSFVLTSETIANTPEGYKLDEEYYLRETSIIAGNAAMPNPDSNGTMTGKEGNGHVRIKLAALNDNNFLSKLVIKSNDQKVDYSPTFNLEKSEYTVNLEPDQTKVTIEARPDHSTATIEGLGEFEIPTGITTKEIIVTSESGKTRSYFVTFNRVAGTDSVPNDIKISGLIDKYCSKDDDYCNLAPSEFAVGTTEYTMTVPYQISQLNFEVIKINDNQFVSGAGTVTLKDVTTNIAINIQSEACVLAGDVTSPGCVTTYSYSITRNFASDADIKSLSIVSPEKELLFDRDVVEYTISVPYEYTSVGLEYVLDSEYATAEVVGNSGFELGWNRVEIRVKAFDGTTKTYGLNIYREKNTSTFLTGIYLSHGEGTNKVNYVLNPPFNKLDFGMYEFNVPNEITEVDLLGVLEETVLSSLEYSTDSTVAKIDSVTGHITDLPTGISFFNIKVTAQDESSDTYKIRIVRAKDNNSLLESLVVKLDDTEIGIGTSFSPNVLMYKFTVPVGTRKLNINAIPQSGMASVSISSTDLVVGDNTITITVTAEDGTQTIYTLIVTRPPSSNNILSGLTIEKYDKDITTELTYTPEFDPTIFEYSLDVPNDVRQIKITGTIADALATINNNGGIYAIAVGDNKIIFTVTSESGSEREYTINVHRAPSSNAWLSSITTSDGQVITMTDHAILTYDINIANSVKDFDFTKIIPEEDTTTYEITKKPTVSPLSTTEVNVFEITTTAEDGTTKKFYTINVTRDKSDNTNLSWLLLKEGIIGPAFDSYTLKYTAKVPFDVTKGTLQIETEDPTSTVSVSNNINSLIVGENIVKITVTAETGIQKEYQITIIRQTEEASSNKLFSLFVDPGKLVPSFDKDVPYYEVEVPHEVSKITVSGDPIDTSDAIVDGMGTYTLKVGRNIIGIRVYSSDNKERDYQIVVTRKPSTEARLKSLVIDGAILTPAFDPDTYFYTTNTQEAYLTFLQITTMQEDATYQVLDNYFSSPSGTYNVRILVTAQDKTTQKEYTIQVNKEPSRNAYLEYLEVEGYTMTPTFLSGISVYTVEVPTGVLSVNVLASPKHPGSMVDGTGIRALSTGVTNIVVTVTSEAGDKFEYTIVVRRPASSDARIKDIILHNGVYYDPTAFDPDVFEYIVEVPYGVNTLDYDVILMSDTAKIIKTEVLITYDFFDTQYWIYVQAEDGTMCVYHIKLKQAKLVSPLLSDLVIEDYLLEPMFNQNVFDYYLYQNNEDTSITFDLIRTLDTDATYTITAPGLTVSGVTGTTCTTASSCGTISGMTNDDTIYDITIEVTDSENKETKQYVIHVYHQTYADNFLSYIYYYLPEIGTEIFYPEPTFDKYTMTYTVDVPNNVTQIDLEAAYPAGLTVTGTGTHFLPTGLTTLPITVVKGGVKRQYLVKVTRAYSSNNNLKNLSLTYEGNEYVDKLNPVFDEDTQNYTLTVDYGTSYLDVNAYLYEGATVTGTGKIDIPIGITNITITVTSEDGTPKVYTIVVTRNASSDNTLIELIPSSGELDPSFTIDETTYSLILPSGVGTLSFIAQTTDGTATITGLESDIVPDGDSVRIITVTPETGDADKKVYTINIHKYSPDNAFLQSLEIGDCVFTPVFNKETYMYEVEVPNSMKSIGPSDVSAVPEDLSATVTKQSTTNLSTTSYTDYAILVTAADGTTKHTYHISIIRKLGADHTLASLSTNTGYIAEKFSPTKYEYTYLIPTTQTEVDESYFKYTLTDENATVQFIPESIDLTDTELPTTMTIRVIAEDMSGYSDYIITLKWDFNSVNTLAKLEVEYGYMTQTFKAGLYTYDVYEYYDTTFDVVTAEAQSDKATIKPEGIGTINFEGKTDFYHYVTVVAEDGSELQYRLHFIVDRLRDENLETFAIEGTGGYDCDDDECKLTPAFDPEVVEYDIAVPYDYILLDWYYQLMNDQQTAITKVNGVETKDRTYKLPVNNKNNTTPTVLTIEVYDGTMKLTKTYTINITRHESDNANLASLKITSTDGKILYPLEPIFNTETYEYQINVENDVEEVLMSAKTSDPNAKVDFNGYNYLIGGEDNIATATVTAPDGTIKIYYVHIIKPAEYNSWLKQITVSTGEFHELTPKFRKTTKNYTLQLSGEVDDVYVDAIPDVPTTIVRGTGKFDIDIGMTVIKLTATAINGSVSIYEIGIIQEASDNMDLKSLTMDGFTFDREFDPSVIHYEADVDETTTNVNITAIPKDPKATVYITGDKDLMTGANTISIQVLSQSKATSKTYQIIATRPVSSNAYLSDLNVYSIKDGDEIDYPLDPSFTSDNYTYDVYVPYDVTGVYVGFEKAVPTSKVSGSGYQALGYGDKEIEIVVNAEDGKEESKKVYTVNIHRAYNPLLEKIEMSNGLKLDTDFNPLQKEYVVTVPNNVKRVYVKGTAQDPVNVTVLGNSTYPSATGILSTTTDETATLLLQDPDGNTLNTYTVIFRRQKNSETSATMISIAEGALSPKFNPETKKYEVHVHQALLGGAVHFSVAPKVTTTSWTAIGNSNLQSGKNEVKVRLTAEDGSTEDYDFDIYVENDEYFSNQLTTLTITYPDNLEYSIALTPNFDPNVNMYTASVAYSVDKISINATSGAHTLITGDTGEKAVDYGNNMFNVTVTNTADTTVPANTYSILIQRGEDNANLAELTAVGHPFVFTQATQEYIIDITDEELSLDLTALPVDPNATVDIFGNGGFVVGENTITITVTTSTGLTKDYVIKARLAVSSNPYLETLTIDGYTYLPEFDSTTSQTYTLTVDSKVNSVLFSGKPVKSGTTCTNLGSVDLKYGENNISILCTASDGLTQHSYDFVITRQASNNTKLMSLTVTPGALNELFNEDLLNYTVTLGQSDGQMIRINASPKDDESTIEGTGEYYLSDKETTIPITVTAADGSKQIYNVTVTIYIDTTPTLSNLWVKEGQISPGFNKNVNTYSLHVPYEVTEVNVVYTRTNDSSVVHITGDKGPDLHGPDGTGEPDGIPDGLEVKTNEVTVTVESPDGEINEYTIYVIRDPFASNQLQKITVRGNDGVYYDLNPAFAGNHLYYEVTVPYSVSKAQVNGKVEDTSSTLSGNKTYNLNVGSNVAYLFVISASNYTRTYTIVITRQSENETPNASYLTSLTEDVEDVDLTPTFDPAITQYTITVPSELNTITLGGTAAPGATVKGFGKSILKYGTNIRTIIVTGTDNSVTNYYVTINRPYTDKTAVTSITPSVGVLNYVDGITEYDMEVEATVASISFDVVTADPLAIVEGNEDTPLASGKNIITITITGTNGEERKIRIYITKSTAVTGIELEKHAIIVGVGESVNVDYEFDPIDTSYTDVTWSIDNPDYVDLAVNGLITGKSPGTSVITITSDFNSSVFDKVTVKVIYKEITLKPNTYDIGTTKVDEKDMKYVYKTAAGTKVNEYMKNFKNETEYLHIYKANGEEIDPTSTDRLATGMYLELIVEDKVIDKATVVVMGDTGDSHLSAVDLNISKKGIENLSNLTEWYLKIALDLNYDGSMTAVDLNMLKLMIKDAE